MPEVTAEDNGDVLTVVEGAWGKAKEKVEEVVYSGVITKGTTYTLENSKKKSDIINDLDNGINVRLFDRWNKNFYELSRNNSGELLFFNTQIAGSTVVFKEILLLGGGSSTTGTVTTIEYTPA